MVNKLKSLGEKFQPGDIVQLKSGGPKMVIERWQNHNHSYKCTWFAGAKHNSEEFEEASINLYEEEKK